MGIENYDITDSSFKKANSSTYNLSILVGLDRFIYSITDRNHKLLVLKSYQFNGVTNYIEKKKCIQETMEEEEQLILNYSKVVVALFDYNSVWVPSEFYEEQQLPGYFKTLLYGSDLDQLQADVIPTLDTHHLYEVNKEIKQVMQSYYPQATFLHLNTAFLNYLCQLESTKKGNTIYINTIAYTMSVFVFKDGELLMVNNYQFKSTKDYLYFIMLIYNQLELKKSTTTIHLSGEVAKSSQVHNLLGRYYSSIEFMDRPSHMTWPNQHLNTPDHYFIDLFSLTLCV